MNVKPPKVGGATEDKPQVLRMRSTDPVGWAGLNHVLSEMKTAHAQ